MVEKLLEETDSIPVLEVEEPGHERLAQEYMAHRESGLLITDYRASFASRASTENLTGEVPETQRVTGGKTVYPGENSWSLLKAAGCWQDFQDQLFPYVENAMEAEAIHPRETLNQKDIFVEGDPDRKGVAMASRLTPRIYGAFVIERSPAPETEELMEQDGVNMEEYRDRMYGFEEETGQALWDEIVDDRAYQLSPEKLRSQLGGADLSFHGYDNMTEPESCIATVGPGDGKPAA